MDHIGATVLSALVAAVLAGATTVSLKSRIGLQRAVTVAVLGATTIAGLGVAWSFGLVTIQIPLLLAGAFLLGLLATKSQFSSSYRAMAIGIAVVAIAMSASGSALPVFAAYWINAVVTVVLFVPLVLMLMNLEGAPNTQVSITPIMVTGAALIGLQRGEHSLGLVALAAGGACVGIAAWHWLGHSRRVGPAPSIFLAVVAIGAGTGFDGKIGWSVLAIGIGLLVIPVTDLFVVIEGRRRQGNLRWGHGTDHLYFRLRAHGLTSRGASAVILAAASAGVTSSCLTAGEFIPWPIGLCIAWALKLGLTFWALRSPDPGGLEQSLRPHGSRP